MKPTGFAYLVVIGFLFLLIATVSGHAANGTANADAPDADTSSVVESGAAAGATPNDTAATVSDAHTDTDKKAASPGGGMLEFSLTGFIFAIVNFLILIGLLYKFLHKPLLTVLEKRRTAIETAQNEARDRTAKAVETQKDYEAKLAGIKEERDVLLTQAKRDADAQREELLTKSRAQAERETESIKRNWERQKREALEEVQDQLLDTSMGLVNRLLKDLADTNCETKLFATLLHELDTMADNNDTDRDTLFAEDTPVRVVSAGTIAEPDRATLTAALEKLATQPVAVVFDEDPELIAGARLEFVSAAIDANVAAILADVRKQADEGIADTNRRDADEQPASTVEPETVERENTP